MVGSPVADKAAARAPRRKKRTARADAARIQSQSLLDVIDNVIDKGLAVDDVVDHIEKRLRLDAGRSLVSDGRADHRG